MIMIGIGFEFEYLKLFHKRKISTSSFLAELLNVKVEVKVLFRRIFVNVSSITLIIPGLELEFFHELLSRLKVKVFCRLISFE